MDKTDPRNLVVGSLLEKASGRSNLIRCLSVLDFKKSDKVVIDSLAQQKRELLESLAAFMGIHDPGNTKLYRNRTKLSYSIVRRFSQLTPSICAECGEKYTTSMNHTPELECNQCGRGAHNCEMVSSVLHLQSQLSLSHMVWLCTECYHESSLRSLPGASTPLNLSKGPRSRNDSTSSVTLRSILDPSQIESQIESESSDIVIIEPRIAAVEGGGEVVQQCVAKEREVDEVKEKKADERPVCESFLEWECKHGIGGKKLVNGKECPNRHLPVCRSFQKFGSSEKGCTDKDCLLFHPKLCRFIQSESSCFNVACKFFHPFGFSKARRAAIKTKSVRDKMKTEDRKKSEVRSGKKKSGESEERKKSEVRTGKKKSGESGREHRGSKKSEDSSQDFRKFEDLLTRLMDRMESMEKQLELMKGLAPEIPKQAVQAMPVPWQIPHPMRFPPQFSQPVCY